MKSCENENKQFFFGKAKVWGKTSAQYCCERGMQLAVIRSKEELNCIQNYFKNAKGSSFANASIFSVGYWDHKLKGIYLSCPDYFELPDDLWLQHDPNNIDGLDSCVCVELTLNIDTSGMKVCQCLEKRHSLCEDLNTTHGPQITQNITLNSAIAKTVNDTITTSAPATQLYNKNVTKIEPEFCDKLKCTKSTITIQASAQFCCRFGMQLAVIRSRKELDCLLEGLLNIPDLPIVSGSAFNVGFGRHKRNGTYFSCPDYSKIPDDLWIENEPNSVNGLKACLNLVLTIDVATSGMRAFFSAANLLVSLVPNPSFRTVYRHPRGGGLNAATQGVSLGTEATQVQHQIYSLLLGLLKKARHYTDLNTHGTGKLAAYFALLTYFAHTRTEKLMFGQYFLDLWQLFHPKLSEPAIPVHHNKQALLIFWNHVTQDCPENVALILQNAHVTKNIAFNYILADHEDQDVVMFNRHMLPAYYALLRACCQQSRAFTRQLAGHQNIQWAFKNITPYPMQYADAVDELFKLMHLFVLKYPDSSEQELHDINIFRRQTLQLYLQSLDGRTSWATLISAFRTLIDSEEDRLFVVYNNGLQLMFDSFYALHLMYHEATACHVGGDLLELLSLLLECAKSVRVLRDAKEAHALLLSCKDWHEALRRLATLLNTYNPAELRSLCLDLLKELLLLAPSESLQILVPLLSHCHTAYQDSQNACPMGPYFPRRGHKLPPSFKVNARPQRPMIQMIVPHSQLDVSRGNDEEYDAALLEYYMPYHSFIDVMCRLAINVDLMNEALVNLSAVVGFESVPLHITLFPKLWLDIHHTQHVERKLSALLVKCSYLVDYMEAVLLDERQCLNNPIVYSFLCIYFPRVSSAVLSEQTCSLIENLVTSLTTMLSAANIRLMAPKLNGDLRALMLAYGSSAPLAVPPTLLPSLEQLLARTRQALLAEQAAEQKKHEEKLAAAAKAAEQAKIEEASKKETPAAEECPSKKCKTEKGEESEEKPISPKKVDEKKDEPSTSKPSEDKTKSPPSDSKTSSEIKTESKTASENKSESKPVALESKPSTSSAPDPKPSCSKVPEITSEINWLQILEKTVSELKQVVERRVGGAEQAAPPQ